jgi:hypothetical protein
VETPFVVMAMAVDAAAAPDAGAICFMFPK